MMNQNWQYIFSPLSEYALHVIWAVRSQFPLLGINSSGKKCGFVSVETVTTQPTHNHQPYVHLASRSPTPAEVIAAVERQDTGPANNSYLQRVLSSRCNPTISCPKKQPDDHITRTGSPSLTLCQIFSLTPAQCIIIPLRPPSLFILSAQLSISISLTHSLTLTFSLSFISYAASSSVCVTAVTSRICQGHVLPSVFSIWGHQTLYIQLLFLHCPPKGHGNCANMETETYKVDRISFGMINRLS